METLTANTIPNKYGFAPTVACIQSGVFKRGMKIVVRFEVLDTKTGKRVTDKDGANIKLDIAAWRRGTRALDDSRQRGCPARLRLDVGYLVGHSAGLPSRLARLSYRRHYQGWSHGDFHSADSENGNGGYSCEDHRLTGLGIKTLSVVLCEGRRQENQQLRS